MVHIYVDGETDSRLVQLLLDDLRTVSYQIIVANGRNAIRPRARKALLMKRVPVALIVDADTTDEHQAAMQQRELDDYLAWGSNHSEYKVIQFIPEIEVLFFEAPKTLALLTGREISAEMQAAGKAAPRKVLSTLLNIRDRAKLFSCLSQANLEELRAHPKISELRSFIHSAS
ncbi:hypothetical protein [Rhodocyclus tenuis]|uniref:DUF4276 family protein n=1 Tax=Rhodocyclus tenuis TaxID=1066 RepID=A0A840FUS7_RHOTE|nr:hypothetical protein [Rhodocyclus tenuis]MBB4245847.1 hypothetical protein [Rhodocyclus tenuis]